MTRLRPIATLALAALAATACKEKPKPVVYQTLPVDKRDIIVSAQASGRIVPDTLIEVKTRASGPVVDIKVETGQQVQRGQLLLTIDPRLLKNTLAQAQAQLDVAKVQMETAQTQLARADTLLQEQTISRQDYETFKLNFYSAKAQFVNAQIAVENAKINLDDADVRASIAGTIIEKNVERGTQIASATSNVGGGTSLMKMADLSLVQALTYVDETDIGKVKPGMEATVTVDAYPNRPFRGTVLKIEPNDTTVQNVTMFPVRVRIQNQEGLLLPGMNAEVNVHIGRREGVLAVSNAALRTQKDVASAAGVLGLTADDVQRQLAANAPTPPAANTTPSDTAPRSVTLGAKTPAGADAAPGRPAANTMSTPDGRTVSLPPGVTEAQVRELFKKRFGGGTLTPAEEATLATVRKAFQAGGGSGRPRGNNNAADFGGSYIVFVSRGGKPTPTQIRTGLTDLDYSEVVTGLKEGDSVYVLPSASMIQSQQEFRDRFKQMTGGGLGGMKATTPAGGAGGAGGGRPGAASGGGRPQ